MILHFFTLTLWFSQDRIRTERCVLWSRLPLPWHTWLPVSLEWSNLSLERQYGHFYILPEPNSHTQHLPRPFAMPSSLLDFLGGSAGKNPPANAGDLGLIPGSGRSPGEGNGNPLQYSCLENPMDREATSRLQSMRVAKESDTTENTHTHTHTPLLAFFCSAFPLQCLFLPVHLALITYPLRIKGQPLTGICRLLILS